jgi:hypothetical protein
MLSDLEERKWNTRLNQAIEWRKRYSFEENWPMIDRHYRHKYEGETIPRFNLIYMMGQTLIPNLVFQNPGVVNTPTRDDMTFMASIWDSIDNWWIRQSEIKDIAKEVVLSCYLHNTTATQTGYDFGTEADVLRENQQSVFSEVEGAVNRTRKHNAPWVDFIPSHRFAVSVGTRTMRKCPWAAKLVSVPTSLLKKQGLKWIQGTKLPDFAMHMEQATWDKKNIDKWTHFWEVHDATDKTFFWLGTNGKYILPPQPDPLQVYGLPFEVTSFNRNSDTFFGTPDAEYVKSQQAEGDEVRLHNMYQRRYSLPKFIYNTNVISPEDVAKMMTATVAPAIPAKLGEGGEDDIRKHIFMFTPPTNMQGYRQYAQDLLNDAQLINGFGPNQMGTFAPGRRTKYETQVVESNNSSRLAFRRNEIAEMIKGHITRANMLMADNWKQEVVQQVVGVDGALYWVKAAPEQLRNIKDGLVTEVNVESLAPVSRERRKMEATNLIGLLGGMQSAGMNTLPLIKQLLSAYEWIDVRQVLPQMSGEYEYVQWEQLQRQKLQSGNNGQQAATNLQGLDALTQRLPSEPQQVGDENGASGSDYSQLSQ